MKDVFPGKKREFIKFVKQFSDGVSGAAGDYDFSPEEIAEMQAEADLLQSGDRELMRLKAEYKGKKIGYDDLIKKVKKNVRRRVRLIRADTNLTGAQVVKLGVKPIDETASRINAPDEPPRLMIINDTQLRHQIKFWEEGSARRRRKPKGVFGAEIRRKIVGVDEKFYPIGYAVRSPHLIEYKAEDVGRQIEYELRWITRRGEYSPLSQTVRAMVMG